MVLSSLTSSTSCWSTWELIPPDTATSTYNTYMGWLQCKRGCDHRFPHLFSLLDNLGTTKSGSEPMSEVGLEALSGWHNTILHCWVSSTASPAAFTCRMDPWFSLWQQLSLHISCTIAWPSCAGESVILTYRLWGWSDWLPTTAWLVVQVLPQRYTWQWAGSLKFNHASLIKIFVG